METKSALKRGPTPRKARPARGPSGEQLERSSAPLYLQLARRIKEEIVSGVYMVGSLLPTEEELCRRFGVSRHTVREALRLLRDEGLVTSRQGAGTLVIPPRSSSGDIQQVMSINDLLTFGTDARFIVESIRTATIDTRLAARTGLAKGSEWLEIDGYRQTRTSDAPLCLTRYYIHRDFAAVGRLLQHHSGPIFPLIENMFGQRIIEVQQLISATLLSSEQAAALKAKADAVALEVRRSYLTDEGKVAQVTINTHPASRFQHSMTMRRIKA